MAFDRLLQPTELLAARAKRALIILMANPVRTVPSGQAGIDGRARRSTNPAYNLNQNQMFTLKLTTIGKSAGLILPKEALSKLNLHKGDTLYLTETKEGYLLTPYNPEFESQMRHAEDVMSRYRNTLKELAK